MKRLALITYFILWSASAVGAKDVTAGMAPFKAQIEAGQPEAAAKELEALLAGAPDDADILNMLGYAKRKMGEFDASRGYYERALTLDPNHKSALEYMGELELQTGNPDAARVLLTRLEALCPAGCEELDDLVEAFEEAGL
ncbi:MAG: tetratricopeptide repeat protein [Pseudomonadota bacterium]